MTDTPRNLSPAEVAKFDAMAARWWDPEGEMRPLHAINPVRMNYIEASVELARVRAVDIGCGGGLLSETLAASGATVTGIDASTAALSVAKLHARMSGLTVDYRVGTAEEFAREETHHYEDRCTADDASPQAPGFDLVTCMELIEHVPSPGSLVAACAALARPGGKVFFSTINRNLKAYAMAILGAEHVLKLLPKGTHEYANFVRPSELANWARPAGLKLEDLKGITFEPFGARFRLSPDVSVNYIARFVRI